MDTEPPEPESPPSADAPTASKLLFLQERMVNFTQQYSMPVVEVSLVLSKYTKQISTHLSAHAAEQGEELPERLSQPWPLGTGDSAADVGQDTEFALEKVLDMVDGDRIDIFDTIIRNVINECELPLTDALLFMREWEHLVRSQLTSASGPGSLFSPVEFPEDF